jgi:hypothetical protein
VLSPKHILVFTLLCGSLAAFVAQGDDQPKIRKSGESSAARAKPVSSPEPSAVSGRRVFRDPETGLMRPPEASEAAPRGQARLRPPSAVIYPLPGGGIARQTPLEEMDFAMVTRQPDGTLSYSCAAGTKRFEHLRTAPKASTDGKENARDR